MDLDFIRRRITQLRMERGVSEYQMSLELGHSKSYIQGISSGRALPSLAELFAICEYFDIEPSVFFDEKKEEPFLVRKALEEMRGLSDQDMLALLSVIERLKDK